MSEPSQRFLKELFNEKRYRNEIKNSRKVSENWEKVIKISEFWKRKGVDASQPNDWLSVASGCSYMLLSCNAF